MTTDDLIDYIKNQIKKNISKEVIISNLKSAGWHEEDIQEGMSKASPVLTAIDIAPSAFAPKMKSIVQEEVKPITSNVIEKESPKVWTPVSIKPVDQATTASVYSPVFEPKPSPIKEESLLVKESTPLSGTVTASATSSLVYKPQEKEELIPTLVPKQEQLKPFISELSKQAILSSYPSDVSSLSSEIVDTHTTKKHKWMKWGVVTLFVLLVLVFAFIYLTVPNINIPFIKKDPKILLSNTPQLFSNLKSYKSETVATLSSPSFANITAGLMNGQVVESPDRDSVSLNAKGMISQKDSKLPVWSYDLDFNSSLLNKDILSNFSYSNNSYFISIPDLSILTKYDTLPTVVVSVPKDKLNQSIDSLPTEIQKKINMFNLDKFLSSSVAPYNNSDVITAFRDFINKTNITTVGIEDIKGVPTYHYEIVADRTITKEFLNKLINIFAINISESEKNSLSDIAGSTNFQGIDVWVGKTDNNIHQYKFTLSVPLSKVIGLNDKGIGGNEVKLDWQTTYYDFDVDNSVATPSSPVEVSSFVKTLNDAKIRSIISDFKPLTTNLRNAEGNYGKRTNPNGSCTNPNPSTLFSPVGHAKSATNALGDIASVMSRLLDATNGAGFCYSTPDSWALAVPVQNSPNSFYCTDSTGKVANLNNPITGPVCK